MKNFEISVLTANSRFLQTAAVNTTNHRKLYCSIELGPVVFDNTHITEHFNS